jgi:hypothetical protein
MFGSSPRLASNLSYHRLLSLEHFPKTDPRLQERLAHGFVIAREEKDVQAVCQPSFECSSTAIGSSLARKEIAT